MNMTDWFQGCVNPVHIGLYEQGTVTVSGNTVGGLYSFWNGKFWGLVEFDKKEAIEYRNSLGRYQNEPWRGLAEKP